MRWFAGQKSRDARDRNAALDRRMASLDDLIDDAARTAEQNAPRVASVTTRAERAAARRAEAIRRNHLDRLVIFDLKH